MLTYSSEIRRARLCFLSGRDDDCRRDVHRTVGAAKEAFVPPTSVPLTLNMEAVTGGPSTLLAGNNFPVSTFNSNLLTDVTTSAVIPPGSPQIGRTLRLVVSVTGQDAGGNPNDPRGTYNVDNIRLDFVPIPEPGAAAIASIGVGCAIGIFRRRRNT